MLRSVYCLINGSLRGLILANRHTPSCIWTALLHLASDSCSTPPELEIYHLKSKLAVHSSLFAFPAAALAFQMKLRL